MSTAGDNYNNLELDTKKSTTTVTAPRESKAGGESDALVRRKKVWMRKKIWSAEDLRRLFRTLDADNSGRLTFAEFKTGLQELGFGYTDDAIKALYKKMDQDGDGAIRESEFLKLFRGINRETLGTQLTDKSSASTEEHTEALDIHVINFGFADGKGVFEEDRYNHNTKKNLFAKDLKEEKKWKKHLRWIDVYGVERDVIEWIGNELDLPGALVEELLLKHSGKVQFFPKENVLEFVLHALQLHERPIIASADIKRSALDVLKGSKGSKADFELAGKVGRYQEPAMISSQVIVLVIADHTILTVRRRTDFDELGGIFNDVKQDTKAFCENITSHMELTSNKEFALSLMNEVNERNWCLRDRFKEWKCTLDSDLHKRPKPYHSRHILDLDRMALAALQATEPFVNGLNHLCEDVAATRPAETTTDKDKKEVSYRSVAAAQLDVASAQEFIGNERVAYQEAAHSCQRFLAALRYSREICVQLNEYYKHCTDEQQNNNLRLLTVITGTIFPMQLWTGVYGMNFEMMPELSYEYSYLIWWILQIVTIIALLRFWHQRGLLD